MKESKSEKDREDVYSKVVRAGRRTYFFDVKATRNNDYYLTLTESKKNSNEDGSVSYEKHKIFLYKEDFDKFTEGLSEAISYIRKNRKEENTEVLAESNGTYTSDVSFEDLSK